MRRDRLDPDERRIGIKTGSGSFWNGFTRIKLRKTLQSMLNLEANLTKAFFMVGGVVIPES